MFPESDARRFFLEPFRFKNGDEQIDDQQSPDDADDDFHYSVNLSKNFPSPTHRKKNTSGSKA
jgi:hypothetical protein